MTCRQRFLFSINITIEIYGCFNQTQDLWVKYLILDLCFFGGGEWGGGHGQNQTLYTTGVDDIYYETLMTGRSPITV
jgi:hypothetical protein